MLTPDEFLCDLCDLAPDVLCNIVRAQAAFLTRPPQPFEALLEYLRGDVPVFIALVRRYLAHDSAGR